jgi:hypothetical protein
MPRKKPLPVLPNQESRPFIPLFRSRRAGQSHVPTDTVFTPYAYFRLFLTDTILNLICKWTNQNAELDDTLWQVLTNKELLAFLGIEIYMGSYQQASRDSYWSTMDP